MATIEKRIIDLEANAAKPEHGSMVMYQHPGETYDEARAKANIPMDFSGKLICVSFVASINASME